MKFSPRFRIFYAASAMFLPEIGSGFDAPFANDVRAHKVLFKISPTPVEARKPVTLTLQRKDLAKPESIAATARNQAPHLVLISSDFKWFRHDQLEQKPDGSFELKMNFPQGGRYRIFSEFVSDNSKQEVESFEVDVRGDLKKAPKFQLTGTQVNEDGYSVTIDHSGVKVGAPAMLTFRIEGSEKITASPNFVTDMECVIFGTSNGSYHHSHSVSSRLPSAMESQSPQRGPLPATSTNATTIAFQTEFSHSGRYIAWLKFMLGKKAQYVSFVFDI